jgi:hypothetical protein
MRGGEYRNSIQVIVYSTVGEYRRKARRLGDHSSGSFDLSADASGFPRRVIHLVQLDDAGRFDVALADRVLPRELCKLVLADWFAGAHCPLYLQEGLSMLAEYGDPGPRILRIGTAIAAGKAVRLEQLTTRERCEEQALALFQDQTYSFVAYLHRQLSARQFAEALEHIRFGCTLADSLQRSLLAPYDEGLLRQLEQAWQNDALDQAQVLASLKRPA